MKRALRIAGKVLLRLIAVLLVLLFVFLAWPQWFLNSRTAAAAVHAFGKSYSPKWADLALEVDSDGLLNKRVIFSADDFCLDEKRGALKGCFTRLKLDARLRLGFSPPVSVTRLETLVVRTGPLLRIDERPSAQEPAAAKKKKKPASVPLALVPRPLRAMTVGLIDVALPRVELVSSTGTTTVRLNAAFWDQKDAPLTADVYAVVQGSAPSVVSHYRANASLDTDLFRKGRVSKLDARATVAGDAGLKADVKAVIREPRPGELSLAARADATDAGRTAKVRLDGLFSDSRASATAAVALEDPRGPLKRAALEDCRFDAPIGKKGVSSADLKCAIAITPKDFGPKAPRVKPLRGGLDFHADFKRLRTQTDHFTARLGVELGPEKTWYGFFMRLKLELAGRTGSLPASLTAKHEFDTGFSIDRFEDLVAGLAHTELAIPAPLDSMKGKASFSARTAGDSRGESQKIDYEAKTSLSSPKQRLFIAVKGALTLVDLFSPSRRAKDETGVDLQDVALELPYLKLGPVPSPVADKRIKTGEPSRDAAVEAKRPEAVKSTSTAVAFTVKVRTEKPLRLITNLIKDQVPIALDLKATGAGLDGTIEIQPFNLQVFRQNARVDHITLKPAAGAESIPIDGKLIYKKNDVVVNILIVGSTDKPVVTFESTPPMTQNEIVAMLLYGKSPAELGSDDQASAGTASSGFASGAFGLASLYLFASTPVDSVSYDPASKTYEVKFKLPGGATLGVGSNLEESKSLTLRRRVAKNIELETELKTSSQQGNAVTTFLEWFRRY
ncbi:MAG TPA: translocation/assembly module TamB domain-containing protein [Elusimicrobiota bacterium]|nr:translocation/assembly module TamB domain-containing protein [Elusimicrobiota bacterium]